MGYPKGDPRQAAARRKWEDNNKEVRKAQNEKKRNAIKEYIREYKESRGCQDCGNKFPYFVLDLDHRSGTEKEVNPANLINSGSWNKVHSELAKCDVVCSNCHRFRTIRRSNGEVI